MLKRRTVVQASLGGGPGGGPGRRSPRSARSGPRWGRPTDAGWRPIAWPFPRDALAAGARLAPRHDSTSMSGPSSASAATATPASSPTRKSTASPTSTCWTSASRRCRKEAASASPTLSGRARLYQLQAEERRPALSPKASPSRYKCDLVVAVIVGNVTDERERKSALSVSRVRTPSRSG